MGVLITFVIFCLLILFFYHGYKCECESYEIDYKHWLKNVEMITVGSRWDAKVKYNTSPFIPKPYGIVKEVKADENGTPWAKVALYTEDGKYMHEEALKIMYSYSPQFFDRFKYKV